MGSETVGSTQNVGGLEISMRADGGLLLPGSSVRSWRTPLVLLVVLISVLSVPTVATAEKLVHEVVAEGSGMAQGQFGLRFAQTSRSIAARSRMGRPIRWAFDRW